MTAAKNPASKTTDYDPSKDANEIEAYFERQAQRTAQGWRPNAGTTLKGEVIGLRMGSSEYGDYPIVVYKVLDMFRRDGSKVDHADTVSLHVFHQVLRERMMELKTDIGSQHFISYLGQVESNSRNDKDGAPVQYHHYDAENVGDEVAGKQEGFTFGS